MVSTPTCLGTGVPSSGRLLNEKEHKAHWIWHSSAETCWSRHHELYFM